MKTIQTIGIQSTIFSKSALLQTLYPQLEKRQDFGKAKELNETKWTVIEKIIHSNTPIPKREM